MNCLSWPKMFKGNSTNIFTGNEASRTCIHLLLGSELGELFGDPDFGLRLKRYTFDQNNYVLKDILIDEIYTQLKTFCPQLLLDRKNITITHDRAGIYANIKCKNNLDFQTSTYDLVLFSNDEQE